MGLPGQATGLMGEDIHLGPGPLRGSFYTGVAGAFDKFTSGNQYTLVIGISNKEQFFFSVIGR